MTDNPNPHPAHKEILDQIPESLHGIVTPILKKWDQGVHDKLAEVRQEYAGYEPFVKNNVDPKFVEQAVMLAQQLQNDPAKVMEEINQTWDLGYVPKDDNSSENEPDDTDDDFLSDDDDIMKHPKVQAMAKSLNEIQSNFDADRQRREEQEAEQELEEYINELEAQTKEENLPFNREFVTAYLAAGVDGETAIKEFHRIIGQATEQPNEEETKENPPSAPSVIGAGGSQGSGNEQETFDVSGSKDSVNTFVADLIKAQQDSGQ